MLKWTGILGAAGLIALVLSGISFSTPAEAVSYSYQNSCQHCHGSDGRGKGPAAKLLPVKTPDWIWEKPAYFSSKDAMAAKLNEIKTDNLKTKRKFYHFTASLTENHLYQLSLYIKKHKGLSNSTRPQIYSRVYDSACAYCHGFSGNGVGVIKGFTKNPENFRDNSIQKLSQDALHQILKKSQQKVIRVKSDVKHLPQGISAGDINNIAAYILTKFNK